MFQHHGIRGRHAPAAQPSVSGDQPVERIARPGEIGGVREPRGGRRVVEDPVFADRQRVWVAIADADATNFVQHLQLEERGGRHEESQVTSSEFPCSRMRLIEPDQRVGIEEDHGA